MTFVTIFGVMGILRSFRLVLEAKTGKEIPESSRSKLLEKFLVNNFIGCRRQHLGRIEKV